MAKKNQKTKVQHIREFIEDYTKNNGEPPTARDIVAGLKKKRVNVTAQSVYQFRSSARKNEGKAKASTLFISRVYWDRVSWRRLGMAISSSGMATSGWSA